MLAFQFKVTLWVGGGVPVPDIVSVVGELVAVLVKATVPEVVPVDWGVKDKFMVALCPEPIVIGREMPLTENSALLMVSDAIVTGPPLADRVTAWDWLVPTTTFPKLTVAGLEESCPGVAPVPLSATETLEFDAFDVIERFPVAAPLEVGVKVTGKLTL